MSAWEILTIVFAVYLAGFLLLSFGLAYASLRDARRRARVLRAMGREALDPADAELVTIVIPAYDEEAGVVDTVRSALASRYPELEVIVVDDGSTDRTLEVLREEFDLEPTAFAFSPGAPAVRPVREVLRSRRDGRLLVAVKENGGKADAVNAGLALARHPWLAVTDADCEIDPDAVARAMAAAAEDPERVVGVAGRLGVSNGLRPGAGVEGGSRLVPRFQILEYQTVFLANRPGWAGLNALTVLAGGYGLWRKDEVLAAGGFSVDLTHEDIEMTWRMHRMQGLERRPYRMASVPEALVWTEVPGGWRDLYRQRKRWQRVVFETVWRYRRMWFNPRHRGAGLLGMPYLLLYEALGPFIEVAAWVAAVVLVLQGELDWWLSVGVLVTSFAVVAILRSLPAAIAPRDLLEDHGSRATLGLGLLALLEFPLYRPIILWARLVAAVEALRGRRTWERVRRAPRTPPPPEGLSS